MISYLFAFIPIWLLAAQCSSFAPCIHQRTSFNINNQNEIMYKTALNMAGFGGGSSAGGKKGKKKTKKNPPPLTLKPKQQWDRYANLKAATAVRVGVRVVRDGEGDDEVHEWLETGKVKSENNESIELAVMMQRGIIAEHSKRLYPLKVLPKDRVEWAFSNSLTPEQSDWILINKDEAGEPPAGFEKVIGFEGKPDPASGFYCHYEDGRLVDRYSGDVVAKE